MVKDSGKVVFIEDNLRGVSELADSLLAHDGRCLWIDVEEATVDLLCLKAWGLPIERRIARLSEVLELHAELLAQTTSPIVVITQIEHAIPLVMDLLDDLPDTEHKIVLSGATSATDQLAYSFPEYRLMTSTQLAVLPQEVVESLGHSRLPGVAAGRNDTPQVSYDTLVHAVHSRLGLPPPDRPTPRKYSGIPACLTKDSAGIASLLCRNDQWLRALEVAAHSAGNELVDILDRAGEAALGQGKMFQFYRRLMRLPHETRISEEVVYWLLIAEKKLGIDSSQYRDVDRLKATAEQPRLRLLLRTLGFYTDLEGYELEEVRADGESVLELVVHAVHLQSFHGPDVESVRHLRRAIAEFAADGRNARMVRTMSILANSLTLQGNYRQAEYWSSEAHRLAHIYNLDELEIAVTSAGTAYAQLLIGKFDSAVALIGTVKHPEGFVGRPSAEAVFSTIADHFVVAGHYKTALYWYEQAANGVQGAASDLQMPDIALMLVRTNQGAEAHRRARARLAEMEPKSAGRPWIQLAVAISTMVDDPLESVSRLRTIVSSDELKLVAPFMARAAILLALLEYTHDRARSLDTLNSAALVLEQLGDSGWQLFAAEKERAVALKQEWADRTSPIEVRFLGDNYWSYRDKSSRYISGIRLHELLLALSLHPEGLTSDQLAEMMDWGYHGHDNVRSNIRRLREFIAVAAGPYRLKNSVDADYLRLGLSIQHGDVTNALKEYGGRLLAESDLRFVREHGAHLEAGLRLLVLNKGTPEQVASLAMRLGDDIELVECALARLNADSNLASVLRARLQALNDEVSST